MFGLIVCAAGLLFGLLTYWQVKKLPVHPSMGGDLRAHL